MSVRTYPVKRVINEVNSDTVSVNSGVVTIKPPFGPPISFRANDVQRCSVVCGGPCTPRVVTVTPIVPATPCDCPWEFRMVLRPNVCNDRVGLVGEGNLNGGFAEYSIGLPTGATPTVNEIVDHLVGQINSDPYRFVTASAVGTQGSYTAIKLTERNCDKEYSTGYNRKTCGFTVLAPSATITEVTAHVSAKYTSEDAFRDAPVGHGQFGLRADLTACGAYCKYYFHIIPSVPNAPAHMLDHGLVTRESELIFIVNSQAPTFETNWHDALYDGGITCLPESAPLPDGGEGSGSGS